MDERFAMLESVMSYISGRTFKTQIPLKSFLPNYFDATPPAKVEKSIEQQAAELHDFKQRLAAMKKNK